MLPAATGLMLRIAIRRDRWLLPIWLIISCGLLAGEAAALHDVYTTRAAREAYATVTTRSLAARMFGAVDGASPGSIMMVEMWLFMAIMVAIVAAFTVIRHTRASETAGRLELVCASAADRRASLFAAMLHVLGGCLLLAITGTASLVAASLPLSGSVLMATSLALVGVAFAGVGAIAGQFAATARTARGLVGIVVTVAFLIRATGDVGGTSTADGLGVRIAPVSWLSALGWGELAYPYSQARWVACLPPIVVAAILVGVAAWIEARRDIGPGLVAPRRRPAGASRALVWPRSRRLRRIVGPLGLAWHQQRNIFLGWLVGGIAVAGFVGAFIGEIDDLMGANPEARDFFMQLSGGAVKLSDAYIAIVLSMLGVMTAAYAVQSLARMREEEVAVLDGMLATSLSRSSWMASHLVVAISCSAALITVVGASTVVATAMAGQAGIVRGWQVMLGAAVQVPALLLVTSVVAVAFAWLPRIAVGLGWGMLGVCLLTHFGPMLRIPDPVIQLSPFSHVPQIPGERLDAGPLVVMTGLSMMLMAAATWRFRRRDINVS